MDLPDSCSRSYHVRFDECAPEGLVRTSVLLRYAQDLAGHHSTARGYTRGWYASRGLAFVVRAADVRLLGRIPVGADLVGTTCVVGWRRVWARRQTTFADTHDTLVAEVLIDWVLLDARGRPTRIPAEFETAFGASQRSVGLTRVDLGPESGTADRAEQVVRPQELDPMNHVNNAVYADWLDEAVIAAGGEEAVRAVPRTVRLDYARAAEPGNRVVTTTWGDLAGGWSCRITDVSGTDLARVRLAPSDPAVVA